MKIALVRREFGALGGAELYLQRLLVALCEEGHEVLLVTADKSARMEGVTVRHVNLVRGRSARVLEFDLRVQEALAEMKLECVFSLERLGRQDVLRAGDGVHASWLNQRRHYTPWWRRWLVGWGKFHRSMKLLEARSFDPLNTGRIIVISDMNRCEILANSNFPPDRIHLVRNGVDISRWRGGNRHGTRKKWGIEENDFLLLFVGSGWERKGLRFVLSAMSRMNNSHIKLVVVGKGNVPRRVPLGAKFVGPMLDVENAYAAADLFVFPPIYEPAANVCFEAMAAGLPVVTSARNGAAEVIEKGINGTVVQDPSDVGSIMTAIEFWRNQPSVRPVRVKTDLSLTRNVRETLEVLMLAAQERANKHE